LKRALILRGAAAAAFLTPAAASAHFILHLPTPTLEQNAIGDPQKSFPCGGTSADPGKPTGAVTAVRGGDTLPIKIEETVYHPGHYRIALAVKDVSELPADPETITRMTERGPWSVSAKIDPDPAPPVLLDGLFAHTTRPEPGSFFEVGLQVPNINCDSCTVQVIQWMAEHGLNKDGDFSYHHCATLKITANPDLPLDQRWPAQ
jgi:hypothetical protein